MTHQRETQKRWRSEGRCIICGDPAAPSKRSKDKKSPYCQKHLDAMNDRARQRNAARQIRKPPVRYIEAKLMMRMLNGHAKKCTPGPEGGRWKFDRVWSGGGQPLPVRRRSFWGDRRGEGYRFALLVCNSTPRCPASALVRLEDIEFAAEGILDS